MPKHLARQRLEGINQQFKAHTAVTSLLILLRLNTVMGKDLQSLTP